MVKKGLKFWLDLSFKIAMLLFGIANFFDYFDLTGKILAAFLLFFLWAHFDPVKLMFGNSKKWMNYVVLTVFYILVLDTFTNIIQTSDTSAGEFQNAIFPVDNLLMKFIPGVYSIPRNFILGLRHETINAGEFSSFYGFLFLIIISLYFTLKVKFDKKSMVYPMLNLIKKSDTLWTKINSTKPTFYSGFKFIITLFTLLIFSHYFFNLVNQWMIVTIGNSTFIIAFFFAVKDIKNTGIKILDKMGNFDEEFIYFLRKIFNHRSYFLVGFSILLTFHYLTEVNLFFIPYLIPVIPIDEYYITLIGGGSHIPVLELLKSEPALNFFGGIANIVVYTFSTLGAFFLFFIPIAFIFMSVAGKNIKDYLEKPHHRALLYVMFVSTTIFMISPWITTVSIGSGEAAGIYGVDMQTNPISQNILSTYNLFSIIVSLSVLCYVFSKNKPVQEYAMTITFLYSIIFLGNYIWKFFLSAVHYYLNIITLLFAESNLFLLFLFVALLLIEGLFYIGGYFYITYKLSRYIITQKTKNIVTNNSIFLWTMVLLIIPIIYLYFGTVESITTATIIAFGFFFFNFAMYKEFTKGFKDDYILSVTIVIILFQVLLIFELVGSKFLPENLSLLTTITLLPVFSLLLLHFFKIKPTLKKIGILDMIPIIFAGLGFGLLFYFFPDTFIALTNLNIGQAIAYIIIAAISEEIIFRGIILNIARKAFSLNRAIFIQSVVFTLVHFIGLRNIIKFYSVLHPTKLLSLVGVLNYSVLLFSFGLFSALLYLKSKKNLMVPIYLHIIVNLVPFMLFRVLV